MHEEPAYLQSGMRYRVEREVHSLEKCPSNNRSVKSNPPIPSGEEFVLIPVRSTTPPSTLGGKGNPTVSLQSGSSSQTPPRGQTPSSGQGTPSVQQT